MNRQLFELEISKTIGGAMGDKTQKFDYTLRLYYPGTDGAEDEAYTGQITAPEGVDWTAGENAGEYRFKLGHGDSLRLERLPYGLSYTITEAQSGEYAATVSVNGGEAAESLTASGVLTADTEVAYVNTLEGEIPTAVGDGNLRLYCLGLGVLTMGAILTLRLRRKEENA